MIKLELIGNIGKDATTQKIGDYNYAKFSLAVSEGKDKTRWIDCLKIDKEGKLTPHLTKGKTIYVSGNPTPNAYIKEGNAVASLTCWVNDLEFVASPKKVEGNTKAAPGNDDLPWE